MKEIPLNNGMVTLVDDGDYEMLARNKWQCAARSTKGLYYAYRMITRGGRSRNISMHRLIMGVTDPRVEIDHKDLNGLNNQKSNLRVATRSQNGANCRKCSKPTSSQFKGVYFRKNRNRWHARIKINGQRKSLGFYVNEEDAARAYNNAAVIAFGEFARLNQV